MRNEQTGLGGVSKEFVGVSPTTYPTDRSFDIK
jgi:hypothetical protein